MRRYIINLFAVIPLLMGLLIVTAAGLKAQTNYALSGVVADAVTGEVLPGAVIRLPGEGGLWTLTDTRGHFLIRLPQGNHGLEVSYIGYQTQLTEVVLDHDKDTVFTLMPMSYYIQGVTVFADSPAKRLSRAEMSIERIDTELIQRVPTLFGEVDLLKWLKLLFLQS